MNSRELRAARQDKLMRRFTAGALSEPVEFTDEQLLEIDRAYAADKDSGALQARQERRALERQMDRQPAHWRSVWEG